MKNSIVFHSLKFRNILSFGNNWNEINLSGSKSVLIEGKNLDNPEAVSSNGSGKSSIIAAIEVALFDKNRFGLTKNDLINNINKSTMEVVIEFSIGDDRYKIHRKRGKDNGNFLYKNDIDITPDSITALNQEIQNILGISFGLFSKIILFTGSENGFLDLSTADQKKLIEELFKLSSLTDKAKSLDGIVKTTDKNLAVAKAIYTEKENNNKRIRKEKEEIQYKKQKWIEDRNNKLIKLEEELNLLNNINLQEQLDIFDDLKKLNDNKQKYNSWITDKNNKLGILYNKLKEINSVDLDKELEKHEQLKTLQLKLTELKQVLQTNKNELIKIEKDNNNRQKEIDSLQNDHCPYCKQVYSNDELLKELVDNFNNTLPIIDSYKQKIDDLTMAIDEVNMDINNIDIVMKDINKVKILLKEKDTIDVTISNTEELVCPYEDVDDSLLKSLRERLLFENRQEVKIMMDRLTEIKVELPNLKNQVNPYEDYIKEEEEISSVEIDQLTCDYDHQKFLYKLLTDKNSYIRKAIIGKTIPFLNSRIDYYVNKLNLPHKVVFNNDMSCDITQFGRTMNHVSAGEKKKINLALSFSFRDVLYYLHSPIKLLVCDEIDSGNLDTHAVLSTISLLKEKCVEEQIPVFVISHRPEFEGKMDEVITVTKQYGFSVLN